MSTHIRSLFLASLALALAAPPAGAATFNVNGTKDQVDALIGDGICLSAEGFCTLRAAVQEAEATIAADVINVPAGKYPLKRVGIFENSSATGDLDLSEDLTINGAGVGVTVIQGKKDRVLDVFGEGTVVTISNLTVTKGAITSKLDVTPEDLDGGGISILQGASATLTDVAVVGNKADDDGGGIANGGTLVATRLTVEKNKAGDDAGGLYTFSSEGSSTVTDCTIAKNAAADEGGAIENQAVMELTNCTISGNKAKDDGGAINNDVGDMTLTNVTVKGNKTSAKTEPGGVENSGGTLTLRNTIFDTNKPFNCSGSLTVVGNNLENGTTCGFAPALAGIKKLGLAALKDNGGGTKTHALRPESPAVDAGTDANCLANDQRGVARFDVPGVGTGTCDLGAYELRPEPM